MATPSAAVKSERPNATVTAVPISGLDWKNRNVTHIRNANTRPTTRDKVDSWDSRAIACAAKVTKVSPK